jgi:hypothetical protein
MVLHSFFLYVIRFKNYSLVFIGIVSSSFIIRIFFHQLLCQIVMEKEIRQSNKKKKREKEKGWRQKENKNTPFPLKKPEFMPSSCFLLVFQ